MRMPLALFLDPIDGQETIRIIHYNSKRTMFEGEKFMCPFFDVEVIGVWTESGRLVIGVA